MRAFRLSLGFLVIVANSALMGVPLCPTDAISACVPGHLTVLKPPSEVFILFPADTIKGIDLTTDWLPGWMNCGVNLHMNVPGVGLAEVPKSGPPGPPFFTFGEVWDGGHEIQGALGYPGDLLRTVSLVATLDQGPTGTFPLSGTLEFWSREEELCDQTTFQSALSGCNMTMIATVHITAVSLPALLAVIRP